MTTNADMELRLASRGIEAHDEWTDAQGNTWHGVLIVTPRTLHGQADMEHISDDDSSDVSPAVAALYRRYGATIGRVYIMGWSTSESLRRRVRRDGNISAV